MVSPKFEHIEYFIEVCRFKSIKKAAANLFITQQALSRSIKQLEEEIGYELFHRTVRGVHLTEEGTQLYERFYPIVCSYQNSVFQLKSKPATKVLSFSVVPSIIQILTPELIFNFCKMHPELKLDIIESFDKQIEQFILEDKRRFGMLVVTGELLSTKTYNYISLFTEPAFLLAHKSNPISKLKNISLAELKNEKVLALPKDYYYMESLNKAVAPFGFSITPHFESTDLVGLISMINRGEGVMLHSKTFYERVAQKDSVLIPIRERTFDYGMAVIFQDFSALDPLAQDYIRYIQESIETYAKSSSNWY